MKGKTYKKPSEFSANRTLQRFFNLYPNANLITVEQALTSAERNKPEFKEKNEGWLSNKLTALYLYGLVRPIYSHNPWRKLEQLELTPKGKKALGREDAPIETDIIGQEQPATATAEQQAPYHRDLTIDEILESLPKINEKLTTHKLKVILEEVHDPDKH